MRNAILLMAFCSTLSAASISALASVTAQCKYVDAAGHRVFSTFSQSTDSGSVGNPCPDTIILGDPYFSVGYVFERSDASAGVSASYGHLLGGVFASSSRDAWGSGGAHASYSDAVTVTNAASGVVRFTFEITGSTSGPFSSPNENHLIVSGSTVASLQLPFPGGSVTKTFDQPFISGIPIFFGADLSASGFAMGPRGFASNSIDQFLTIQVLDSLGAPLTGATVSFDSGGVYAVPEPSFWGMVGMGLAIMEGIRRMRKSCALPGV